MSGTVVGLMRDDAPGGKSIDAVDERSSPFTAFNRVLLVGRVVARLATARSLSGNDAEGRDGSQCR